jgi:hypothetical protein
MPARLVALAERFAGEVRAVEPCSGGGNNRVYRILTGDRVVAGKVYGSGLDERDRLGHEFGGLSFLKSSGIGKAVPAALASDTTGGCALYEWIEGERPAEHGVADIGAVLDLLSGLHRVRHAAGAADLPAATEAVLSPADLVGQIAGRLARLSSLGPSEPALAAFLATELQPEVERRMASIRDSDPGARLSATCRTLSPSDFGFHNALRRPDGLLTFIDFEYFGWDDPVKLCADFLWHPAMRLSEDERAAFLEGVTRLYGHDESFSTRLDACFPIYGIRWMLIILNEFVPQLWARRSFAGKGGDWEAAKSEQLDKARAMLAAVRSYPEGIFHA